MTFERAKSFLWDALEGKRVTVRPYMRKGTPVRGHTRVIDDPKGTLLELDWHVLRERDKVFQERIMDWLQDKSSKMPKPEMLYRGVPKGSTQSTRGEYVHGTPWAYVAARAGKGAFGDPEASDVYAYPVSDKTLFYRGGSLEGDPLEETRIHSAQGMTWQEIMMQAKQLYRADLARERKLRKDFWDEEQSPRYVANEVLRDVTNASFEVDLAGRPGIWRGKTVPKEVDRDRPHLRSYSDLKRYVQKRRAAGISDSDIPEIRILKRAGKL